MALLPKYLCHHQRYIEVIKYVQSEETFIFTDVTISGSNFLETIPLFKKEYKVSAIFIFNSWTKGNVIRFTLGNDWSQPGDTHPAVWMDTNGVERSKF